jgi:glycosyltransferase involved in cell wall biosynthesis
VTRILFVSHSAELNGAELWLLETFRRLDRGRYLPILAAPRAGPLADAATARGLDVHIIAMKWWLTERSRVWRQPAAAILNIAAVRKLAALARAEGAGLVFSNSAAISAGGRAARAAGLPHVWAVHEILGGPRPFLVHALGRRTATHFILKHSARVIVNSEASRAAFPPSDKLRLVYNGVEVSRGDERRQAALRSDVGLRSGDIVAGVIGKIYAGKGQREALQAAAVLAPRYPRLKWLVVGAVGDERYGRGLRAMVRSAGLGDRVLFTGYQPDLVNLMKIMTVVVIPSVVESFGRVALEAMAAGVPVVAVRAGGLPEIVVHGENGFLAETADPVVLADTLEFVLRNPDKAKAAADQGLRTVREKFSVELQVRAVERVLDEAVKSLR